MPLAPGTRLGPYEIGASLGAGGMGEVYRAKDTRLERTVAIKVLPAQFSADPVRKQRFEREAKTISSLNHPHICTLHDIGSQDGVDYLVMECVEGQTLAKRLEKGPLPLEQVLKYGAQIADALDKAHRSGVVHRDLKPGNIVLPATGAKLLDFGLAKPTAPLASIATLTAATPRSPMTEEGTIVGTFQYMSPEQVEGRELDGRSDPLLSNLYMRRFVLGWKKLGHEKRLTAYVVNYADDLVICCRGRAEEALATMRDIMGKLKLTVNETKTRVCKLPEEKFDFLGYTFGRCYSQKTGRAYIGTVPSKKRVIRICEAISEMTERDQTLLDQEIVVAKLNRMMIGLANYFCLGPVSKAYRAVESHACKRLRQWLCAKHKVMSGTKRFSEASLYDVLGLVRLTKRTRTLPWATS